MTITLGEWFTDVLSAGAHNLVLKRPFLLVQHKRKRSVRKLTAGISTSCFLPRFVGRGHLRASRVIELSRTLGIRIRWITWSEKSIVDCQGLRMKWVRWACTQILSQFWGTHHIGNIDVRIALERFEINRLNCSTTYFPNNSISLAQVISRETEVHLLGLTCLLIRLALGTT